MPCSGWLALHGVNPNLKKSVLYHTYLYLNENLHKQGVNSHERWHKNFKDNFPISSIFPIISTLLSEDEILYFEK